MRTKLKVVVEVFEDGSVETTVYDHGAEGVHYKHARRGPREAKAKLEKKYIHMIAEPILML